MTQPTSQRGPYEVGARMRHTDAFAWRMEADPRLRSTVVALWLLDSPPDYQRVVDRFDRATRLLPVFRQRVVEPPLRLGPPRFELDSRFDIDWHVRRIAAPAPGSLAPVLDYAGRLTTTAFDPARPLWEVTVVEGLADGRAAMIAKFHHSLADGIGGMQISGLLFDTAATARDEGTAPPVPQPRRAAPLAGPLSVAHGLAAAGLSGVTASANAVLHPLHAVAAGVGTIRSVGDTVKPMTHTLSPVMAERGLSRALGTLDVAQADLLRTAHAAGCSLNDAFVAALCGALRRYHEPRGDVPAELRVTMPISIRRAGDQLGGNRITLARFLVPVAERDPRARMRILHQRTASWRRAPSLGLTQQIAAGLNLVPRSYLQGMLAHVDVLASNVHGPDRPLYLGGAGVTAEYAFGPTIGAAINVTMLTYQDVCHVGSSADLAAVADHEAWLSCLHDGFDEVVAAAGEPTATIAGGPA